MWLGGGKPGRWTTEDLLLLAALTAYEDGICGGCGQPKDRVYTDAELTGDQTGYVDRRSIHCEGCAALGDKHAHNPEPGDKDYLVWVSRR